MVLQSIIESAQIAHMPSNRNKRTANSYVPFFISSLRLNLFIFRSSVLFIVASPRLISLVGITGVVFFRSIADTISRI